MSDPQSSGLWAAVQQHGREAVSFQGLKLGLAVWTDESTGALVQYVDTGGAWVAAGLPLADESARNEVARRFSDAGLRAHRRVCWFCGEQSLDGFRNLLIGQQPEWEPQDWPRTVSHSRGLKEQLRRARAAGVTARRVRPDEISEGSPMRTGIDALAQRWLAHRRMEPMEFLVALVPFRYPEAHRYFVAERDGQLVGFLSLLPIPGRQGWLFEDLLRDESTPNGTSELLTDHAMRAVRAEGAETVTLGLAPLSGDVSTGLRWARFLTRGLYDFRGLRAFKQRLHPCLWRNIWLAVPARGSLVVALFDVLRAFTGNRLWRFVVRTIVRHPGATCFALALPLVPWTLALAILVACGAQGPLGFSRGALGAWTLFDAILDVGLWRAAFRPRLSALTALAVMASADAVASVFRVQQVGMGHGLGETLLRFMATAAPVGGTAALWWAAFHAQRRKVNVRPALSTGATGAPSAG